MTKQTDNQSLALEKSFTKMDLLSHIANEVGLPRKKVEEVFTAFTDVACAHLKKGLTFSFIGLLKFYTIDKEAVAERDAPNPFTGKITRFPAKPAHKAVRVKALKKLKEMIN